MDFDSIWKINKKSHELDKNHVHESDAVDGGSNRIIKEEDPEIIVEDTFKPLDVLPFLSRPWADTKGPHYHGGASSPDRLLAHLVHQHGQTTFSDQLDNVEKHLWVPVSRLKKGLTLSELFDFHRAIVNKHDDLHLLEDKKKLK